MLPKKIKVVLGFSVFIAMSLSSINAFAIEVADAAQQAEVLTKDPATSVSVTEPKEAATPAAELQTKQEESDASQLLKDVEAIQIPQQEDTVPREPVIYNDALIVVKDAYRDSFRIKFCPENYRAGQLQCVNNQAATPDSPAIIEGLSGQEYLDAAFGPGTTKYAGLGAINIFRNKSMLYNYVIYYRYAE